LLDINVLIALLDAGHAMHERAHAWWGEKNPPWASCPLTENGVVRIMSSPAYGQTRRFGISQIVTSWNTFIGETDHEFWPDAISVCDATRVRHDRILTPRHLTDVYLLALAVERDGQLVTFDQGIPVTAVLGAGTGHLVAL
jgi:toxin-antitoxin system PIN domain toxin